jgi:hypothetical protein
MQCVGGTWVYQDVEIVERNWSDLGLSEITDDYAGLLQNLMLLLEQVQLLTLYWTSYLFMGEA